MADLDASLMQRLDEDSATNHKLMESLKATQVGMHQCLLHLCLCDVCSKGKRELQRSWLLHSLVQIRG